MSYKSQIDKALSRFGTTNGTKNPDETDNIGAHLGEFYLWDTVADLARKRASDTMKSLETGGLIPSKDKLREDIGEEKIICKSPHFVLSSKVSSPRTSFDKDKFIELASEKFYIDRHRLIELASICVKESAAPVSLKIMEVE